MRLVTFASIELPQWQAESGIPRQARTNLLQMQSGVYDQDGMGVYLSPQTLSHRAVIIDDDIDIDDNLDALTTLLGNSPAIIKARLRDGTTYRQTWARLVSLSEDMSLSTTRVQPVVMQFQQLYPYWLASADEPHYLDDGEGIDGAWLLDSGHAESRSITTLPHTFTITNTGGATVYRGIITITVAAASSITKLRITNLTNGATWLYEATLAAGEVLTIDMLTKTVMLAGANAYTNVVCLDVDWLPLERGANVIRVDAEAITDTVALRWEWARHYI